MNYFELFGIPVSLQVDKSLITRRFFELQKKYHPDFFGQASDNEKEEALEMSSMANKAFKTFQSPDETIKYVLQLEGLLEDEEKFQLPPDFLMEVMELNEMKMDDVPEATIKEKTNELLADIYAEVKPIISGFKASETAPEELQKVKLYYFKKKYLDRLLAE